jgi:hypothetical protein
MQQLASFPLTSVHIQHTANTNCKQWRIVVLGCACMLYEVSWNSDSWFKSWNGRHRGSTAISEVYSKKSILKLQHCPHVIHGLVHEQTSNHFLLTCVAALR